MTVAHWLAIILALVALAYRKHLGAILRWNPLAMLASVLIIALVAGWIVLALWLIKTWDAWGAVGALCLTGLCVVALRLYTGCWYWQDDDVINLD